MPILARGYGSSADQAELDLSQARGSGRAILLHGPRRRHLSNVFKIMWIPALTASGLADAFCSDVALAPKEGMCTPLTSERGGARERPKEESVMAQQMKLTESVIKPDIGSVAGHNRPHPDLLKQAEASLSAAGARGGRAGVHRAAERARGDPASRQNRPGGLAVTAHFDTTPISPSTGEQEERRTGPMETRRWRLRNGWQNTLLVMTILFLIWGLVRPTDALADRITSSSGTWTAQCEMPPDGLACLPDQFLVSGVMMPAGREGFAATVNNNQIIVSHGSVNCGLGCEGDTPHTRIYPIQKDTWSSGADAPTSRAELAGATDGHLHYAVGGRGICVPNTVSPFSPPFFFGLCKNLEAYDPVKDSWATLLSMPTERAGLAAAVVGHKLYAIGGRTAGAGGFIKPGTGTALSCVEAYDIAADKWTSSPDCSGYVSGALAPLNIPVMDVAAIAIGGKIYVIGGVTGPDVAGVPQLVHSMQIYDVTKNFWTSVTGLSIQRANLALANCGSVILALGGRTNTPSTSNTSNAVEAYEIATKTWTTCTADKCLMPTAKSEHGAVSHGDVVHVLGSGIFGAAHDNHEALKCSSLFNK